MPCDPFPRASLSLSSPLLSLRPAFESADHKKAEEKLSAQTAVCRLLSSRCKDIQMRDVVLERDSICEETCSKTFTALGLAWEVIMSKPTGK